MFGYKSIMHLMKSFLCCLVQNSLLYISLLFPQCLIHIFVDSCSGLGDPGDPSYNTSPMVELFNGRDNQRSWPQYYNNDPVIEQGFVMLSRSPYTDEIRINVVDKNAKSKKKQVVGTTSIRVWSLIEQPGMEYPMQPFILKGHAPNAQICLSASLRGLVRPESGSPRRSVIHKDPKNPGSFQFQSCK